MTRPDSGTHVPLDRTATETTSRPLLRSGVDVVGIDRIARLLDEFDRSFKGRVFTPAERAYCDRRPDPDQHYAARWAAKEAFRKAVTTAGPSVPFDAVGVARTADGPTLALGPAAEEALAHTLGRANAVTEQAATSVSLAHDQPAGTAIAHVVIARAGPGIDASPSAHGDER